MRIPIVYKVCCYDIFGWAISTGRLVDSVPSAISARVAYFCVLPTDKKTGPNMHIPVDVGIDL